MKIKAEKWIIDDGSVFKLLEIEKCCDDLINSDYVTLNNEYETSEGYDENNYSVKLHREEHYNSYGDNFSDDYYNTINFCPYCGKPIVIEIANTVDKTEEYKMLRKQRDDLWAKCCKTDSKKKEELLKKQVGELDGKINDMFTTDDFNKVGGKINE